MNRLGSIRVGAACALVAILTLGCASVELASPTPGPTDAPTPTSPAPFSTPSLAPTAPPTPAPTPTTGPTTPPGPALSAAEIITRLVAFSVSDETYALTMEATADGTVGAQGTSADIDVFGDGAGQDFVGTTILSSPGLTLSFEMVVIGDQVWVQATGSEDWTPGPRDETQPIQPVFDIAPEDVTYVGLADIDGAPGHRLTINRWTGGDLRSNGYKRVRITLINYDVLTNNDGYPIEVDLNYNVRARITGLPLDADYFIHYVLSDFGKAVAIEPPI